MDSMKITDEALDAASEFLPMDCNRAQLGAALEAAAPHMHAEAKAWYEGWFAAREFYVKADVPEAGIETNPYMSQA